MVARARFRSPHFGDEHILVRDAAVQALAAQDADLDLAMFGQLPCFGV
jgi:hypothetical protein